jgi:hypothetical protein
MTDAKFGDPISSGERRDSDRKKLIVDVRFEGGDGTGIANTRDIGIGGLYMTTSALLDIGTPVMMAMNVGSRSMKLGGVVVYADPGHGVGVRFKDANAEDLEFLRSELDLAS